MVAQVAEGKFLFLQLIGCLQREEQGAEEGGQVESDRQDIFRCIHGHADQGQDQADQQAGDGADWRRERRWCERLALSSPGFRETVLSPRASIVSRTFSLCQQRPIAAHQHSFKDGAGILFYTEKVRSPIFLWDCSYIFQQLEGFSAHIGGGGRFLMKESTHPQMVSNLRHFM